MNRSSVSVRSVVLLWVVSLSVFTEVFAQDKAGKILFITKNGEMVRAEAPDTEKVLFRNQRAKTVIEWSLSHARITVLRNGTFEVDRTVRIPVSKTALIVGPDAKLAASPEAKLTPLTEGHGVRTPLILNQWKDDVTIMNLGTLDAGGAPEPGGNEVGVLFDGRNGGASGIEGGMLFLPGREVRCSNKAIYVIDAKNVQIPLVINASRSHGASTIEGCVNSTIGTVAALAGEKAGENEAVDLNSYNKGLEMDTIIGTSPSEQILDINNSPQCEAQQVVGYGEPEGMTLVNMPQYPPGGRRLTQRLHIDNSDGSGVGKQRVVGKDVAGWKRELEVMNFPEGLPEMTVKVKLTVEFQDGSVERVLEHTFQGRVQNTRN